MIGYFGVAVISRVFLSICVILTAAPALCGDRQGPIDVLGEFARTAAPGWKKSALDFERDRDLPAFSRTITINSLTGEGSLERAIYEANLAIKDDILIVFDGKMAQAGQFRSLNIANLEIKNRVGLLYIRGPGVTAGTCDLAVSVPGEYTRVSLTKVADPFECLNRRGRWSPMVNLAFDQDARAGDEAFAAARVMMTVNQGARLTLSGLGIMGDDLVDGAALINKGNLRIEHSLLSIGTVSTGVINLGELSFKSSFIQLSRAAIGVAAFDGIGDRDKVSFEFCFLRLADDAVGVFARERSLPGNFEFAGSVVGLSESAMPFFESNAGTVKASVSITNSVFAPAN
jgi:hypothetical protein